MSRVITIYGRDDCRYCAAAVAHCLKKGYRHEYRDVTSRSGWWMDDLIRRMGHEPETVPQIFLGDHHIGGFTDLQASDAVIQQIIGGQ